jgi:hypothetical protein
MPKKELWDVERKKYGRFKRKKKEEKVIKKENEMG